MIKFKQQQQIELITLEDITNFENEIGYTFPSDYKQHMLKYNGGEHVIVMFISMKRKGLNSHIFIH